MFTSQITGATVFENNPATNPECFLKHQVKTKKTKMIFKDKYRFEVLSLIFQPVIFINFNCRHDDQRKHQQADHPKNPA